MFIPGDELDIPGQDTNLLAERCLYSIYTSTSRCKADVNWNGFAAAAIHHPAFRPGTGSIGLLGNADGCLGGIRSCATHRIFLRDREQCITPGSSAVSYIAKAAGRHSSNSTGGDTGSAGATGLGCSQLVVDVG